MNCPENQYKNLTYPTPGGSRGGGGVWGSTFQKSGKFHVLLRKSIHFLPPPPPYPTGGGLGVKIGGREGRDVMAIMKLVHMAWNGCTIGNSSEAG